ncbi:alkaline phosphatase family protein [Candidatus Woesearchaeota archaeon]|nr:alkaline phosphatase family protein [Candidatus Woesearchaeota archaeon]
MREGKRGKIKDLRYESVMKRLDLKKARPSKRKFIIIQIDSLPCSILKQFLDRGSCRFMKRLIDKEGYHLQSFNCGVPSGTPAVQSGIMYGDNSAIPGFRFVDKRKRRQFSFGNPNHVKFIENTFFAGKKGILEGGASYSNIFSGGAQRSIFTMSTITKDKRFRRIKESSLWLFLLLHPASLWRVIYYSVAELLIESVEIITHPVMRLFGKRKAIFGFRIPFRRILMNVILTEIITIGAILDIRRGLPKIYLNYLSYDDIAHLRGPHSTAAFFMVRALDRRIRRIVNSIKDDGYDVFIMSDHGQVDSVPFRTVEGITLAQFIEKCAHVGSFGLSSANEGRLSLISVLMRKTLDFMKYVSSPLRWMGSSFARGMMNVIRPQSFRFVWDEDERIFVADSCSLANVYFSASREMMDLRQINRKYPLLVEKLLRNRSIGVVMAKQGDRVMLMHRRGMVIIGNDFVRKQGRDFLHEYGDEETLISQLRGFSKVKFLGDLVLFGKYKDGVAVSFTEHVGAHGGIGGDMMHPFFISKRKYDLGKVENARELNKIFQEY